MALLLAGCSEGIHEPQTYLIQFGGIAHRSCHSNNKLLARLAHKVALSIVLYGGQLLACGCLQLYCEEVVPPGHPVSRQELLGRMQFLLLLPPSYKCTASLASGQYSI